jgi:polyphenol oxidase
VRWNDCQAAILYDPIHRALANVHAGWRGNVQNIYRTAVQKMVHSFGSKPQDLLVGISPSIGPKHAEFKNYKSEFPEEFWEFQVKPTYFDLWQIARHQFESSGVLAHHIQIAEICTFDHPSDYFSYRRDKTTGRHATVAMLKPFS